MVCIKISKDVGSDRDLLFVSLYVPPYQTSYYKQSDTNCSTHHLEEFRLNLYQTGETSYLMVCGDLNVRIGDWNLSLDDVTDLLLDGVCGDNTRKSKDKITNQSGKMFVDRKKTFKKLLTFGILALNQS